MAKATSKVIYEMCDPVQWILYFIFIPDIIFLVPSSCKNRSGHYRHDVIKKKGPTRLVDRIINFEDVWPLMRPRDYDTLARLYVSSG